MESYSIPIMWGTSKDLSVFDFSFKGIIILDIESQEFEDYILSLNSGYSFNVSFVRQALGKSFDIYDKKYAVVHKNFTDKISIKDLYNVFRLLLIIFPSDLQITNEVNLENNVAQGWIITSITRNKTSFIREYHGDLLFYRDNYVSELNEYLKLVFNRIDKIGYLDLAIYHYLTSYQTPHRHFIYSSLYTALETIIPQGSELKYRLKRNVAIICGNTKFECKIISENINKFGNLRNNIVHGNSGFHKKLDTYIPRIRNLVSRVIIELLLHEISEIKSLDEILTEIGYGDRNKISKDWKKYELNSLCLNDIDIPIENKK